MKQRKMRKKEHKAKISILTGMLMLVTLVLLFTAIYTSINNRALFLKVKNAVVLEISNSLGIDLRNELEVACNVVSIVRNNDRASALVSMSANEIGRVKEYRYYIKEVTNDMYVLEDLTNESTFVFSNLKLGTSYDIKVVAVEYDNSEVMTTAFVKTPSID